MPDKPNLTSDQYILVGLMPIACYRKDFRLMEMWYATQRQKPPKPNPVRGCTSKWSLLNFFKVTKPRMENLHKANIQIQFAAYFIIIFFSKLLFSVFRVPNRFSLFRKCV